MTPANLDALAWLSRRHGDGCFDRHGVLLAAGETGPFVRANWNALRALGLLEFYNPAGRGYGRARLTAAGLERSRALDVQLRADRQKF